MSAKQVAFEDMKTSGLNVSLFLYDRWYCNADDASSEE